jgi:hypothetical protein
LATLTLLALIGGIILIAGSQVPAPLGLDTVNRALRSCLEGCNLSVRSFPPPVTNSSYNIDASLWKGVTLTLSTTSLHPITIEINYYNISAPLTEQPYLTLAPSTHSDLTVAIPWEGTWEISVINAVNLTNSFNLTGNAIDSSTHLQLLYPGVLALFAGLGVIVIPRLRHHGEIVSSTMLRLVS